MPADESVTCPVSDCSVTDTLSQILHHIATTDDTAHTRDALDFAHSYAFRRAYEAGELTPSSGSNATQSTTEAEDSAGDGINDTTLLDVPGIGPSRADSFRAAGYTDISSLDQATVEQLAAVDGISRDVARVICVGAGDLCGRDNTFTAELAQSLDVSRGTVQEAYEPLAGLGVPPEEAEQTLRLHFRAETSNSIVSLEAESLRYLHLLRVNGFETTDEVATADIDTLADTPYLNQQRAQRIRRQARLQAEPDAESPDGPPPSTAPAVGDSVTESPATSPDATETANSESRTTSAEESVTPPSQAATESGVFPPAMREQPRWLLWRPTEDGRKVPRAPWETGDPVQFVSAMEPANWTTFDEARRWQEQLPQNFELAYTLTRDDDVVFIDLDDVVQDGSITSEAARLVAEADSYTAVSTSGTGLHIFIEGALSEGIKSLTGPLDDTGGQSIEIYERNRFVAMTGNHLAPAPNTITPASGLLQRLENQFAAVDESTPDSQTTPARQDRETLSNLDQTSDIQDIFDAINQVGPSDIRLRSTQTDTQGDGSISYNPSWVYSESGTRLAALDDIFVYRKGMIALNALQVVALEEGLITDERTYPEGETFWQAVEALRNRGAHIPEYEPPSASGRSRSTVDSTAGADNSDSIATQPIATALNYGSPVRTHIHPYDRDYNEDKALQLAPILASAAESLRLPETVAVRAGEVYTYGHTAGIIGGASHECSLAASLRIASIELDHPRPLDAIAATFDEASKTVRTKFHRFFQETPLTDDLSASDLVIEPVEYVPYLAAKLRLEETDEVPKLAEQRLSAASVGTGTDPVSLVAAAFYAASRDTDSRLTQGKIADAADISKVTIRNNYHQFES